ncbi:hypothetical protein X751_16530 [Mesorhizobium sp. LNJC395A00]|nr:hypothetical protein X751_16530 [Mesorhizobium sp. LNJC395A00]
MVRDTSKRLSVLVFIQLPWRLIQLSTIISRWKGLKQSAWIQRISMR